MQQALNFVPPPQVPVNSLYNMYSSQDFQNKSSYYVFQNVPTYTSSEIANNEDKLVISYLKYVTCVFHLCALRCAEQAAVWKVYFKAFVSQRPQCF